MRSSSRFESLISCLLRLCLLAAPLALGGWQAQGDQMLAGHQSTLVVDGPVAEAQRHVFYVTLVVALFIFVVVGAVLAYATIKFRARNAADEHAEPPPQSHGNPLVEIGLIVVSILMLVVIAVPTLKAIWYTHHIPEELKGQAMTVRATGYQWWFKFEYPDHQGFATANELVIPVDTPVRIELRTMDVIHSFWLPKLAGKVDMIPNRGNSLWLLANKTGYYWGQCAEFCGESHGNMRFRAIVLSRDDFAAWVKRQQLPARTVTAAGRPAPRNGAAALAPKFERTRFAKPMMDVWTDSALPDVDEDPSLVAKGRQLFQQKTCVGCHTVRGHEGVGTRGPDLTHFGARTTIASAILDNTPENLKRWIMHPNEVKPGNKMWFGGYTIQGRPGDPWTEAFTVNEAEADALVAYLRSLR